MRKRSLAATFLVFSVLSVVSGSALADRPAIAKKNLDLTYISDDFFGMLVLHPQRMARSPVVAPRLQELLDSPPMKELEKEIGLDLLRLEQVLVLFVVPPQKPSGADSSAPSIVLRFSAPADTVSIAKDLIGLSGGRNRTIADVEIVGKKCFKVAPPADKPEKAKDKAKEETKEKQTKRPARQPYVPPVMTCAADERTVLVCFRGEADLKKMLSPGEVKSPLVDRLRRFDVSSEAAMVIALDPVRELCKEELKSSQRRQRDTTEPPLFEVLTLVQYITGTLTLDGDTLGRLVLHVERPEQVAKVEELSKVFPQKIREEVEQQRKRIAESGPRNPEYREVMERQAELMEQFANAISITKTESRVVATLKRTKGLEAALFKMLRY